MAVITVTADSVPLVSSASSLTLRVFSRNGVNGMWTTFAGVTIQTGEAWYTDYTCPVTSNVAARPEITLHSTTDRLEQWADPRWFAVWLDGEQVIGQYFWGYQVPATPTTTTKAALDSYQPVINNNQRWNNQAYNTTQSNTLFPQLAGLTPGTLPKVRTDVPAEFDDSLYSDDGTDAVIGIDTGDLILGTEFPAHLRRSGGPFPGHGPVIEILDGAGDPSYFISGGAKLNFGLLGTADLSTNSAAQQTIFTPDHDAIIALVIIRAATANVSAWPGQIEIGSDGGSDFGTYDASDLGLSDSSSYAILQNFQAGLGNIFRGRVAAEGLPFTINPTNASGVISSATWDVYGYYIF